MNLTMRIWRQATPDQEGRLETYKLEGVEESMSMLETLDMLNEQLIEGGERAIEFESDCREGICGSCCLTIDGRAHGPGAGATACQVFMREYKDGDTLTIEPFRASAFPSICDLTVDRSAFDRIIQAGGYVTVNTGNPPDGNALPVPKVDAEAAMDAAACIGCGACVAACKNSAAMLFVGAKVEHLARTPQGEVEGGERVLSMVHQMDAEGFGNCTNQRECEAVCPKLIPYEVISKLNRRYVKASLFG